MFLQVRWWDVTAGEQVFRLEGHTDYVRSSACSPSSPDTWATGDPVFPKLYRLERHHTLFWRQLDLNPRSMRMFESVMSFVQVLMITHAGCGTSELKR